ncbi:proline iminopeptidase-family hydrolase [Vibrio sp. S4M6]|uniref:proline iminopeptidase-family hydrolase n=1 Tax=Vibrio sinus TaxID=2946865 RepID=UPI00202A73BE|nr:proline iminopeptidase-family hydrolase [Vibrio sinus]MCL9780009.1 proline iminopeptidase-family hydrolase [Vibrio sinus]
MRAGFVDVTGGKIFWRSVGEGSKTPILAVHGGPGGSHDILLEPLSNLAKDRQVIFYDQLGGGRSDRPNDRSLWTIPRFVEEIAILREALGLEKVILEGGSWGTTVVAEYLFTKPSGVEAAIFSSPCLNAKMWKEDADRLRLKLPINVQETLIKHESAKTTHSSEYKAAMWEYIKRYVCLIDPIPEKILDVFNDTNHDIYEYMWGPSEFYPTGTLKNYDATSRLPDIDIPTLFICGREDEATPESTTYFSSLVPDSRVEIIEGASHLALIEKSEEFVSAIDSFLIKKG